MSEMEPCLPELDRSSHRLSLMRTDRQLETDALLEMLGQTGHLLAQPSISSSLESARLLSKLGLRLAWLASRYPLSDRDRSLVREMQLAHQRRLEVLRRPAL